MSDTTIYKKVFHKYWVKQHRNISHIPVSDGRDNVYDGKHPFFDVVSILSDEDSFKKNLKDPLFSVLQETLTVVVEKKGPKVSFKIFEKKFGRNVGTSYFKLQRYVRFITVNLEKGNVYFGHLNNYQNKKKVQRKITSNFFVNDPFNDFRIVLKSKLSQFITEENSNITNEASEIFMKHVDGGQKNSLSFSNRIFKFYLDSKKIKYPNNFSIYSNEVWGDFRKKLKKFDNKIVETFMFTNELSGKKIKKVLHSVSNLNTGNYKSGLRLFGQDWLNQDEELLKDIFNNSISFDLPISYTNAFNTLVTPKEKKRIFNLFKIFNKNQEIDSWTLRDHFIFYVQLKRYGATDIEWKSDGESLEKFRQEHLDWTDKLSFYKKGHYDRIYPQSYFKAIKNFEVDEINYFPKLLTNTKEYNEESCVQSNCVRTYIGMSSSLIVSLRKDSEESTDRLTVEYKVGRTPNSLFVYIQRVQTKAKHNQNPNDIWSKPLQILDEMMDQLVVNNRFEFYKLKKKCNNGIELESEVEFNEEGRLKWTYQAIDNDSNWINFFE